MNISGSKTNEAVLEDPRTVAWMGARSDSDDGPRKVPIFGHTETISLLKTLIELQTHQSLPRPVIPGLELRLQRKITRTHNAVEAAQQRNRARREKRESLQQ